MFARAYDSHGKKIKGELPGCYVGTTELEQKVSQNIKAILQKENL
jgi:hypothetical protein